MGLLAHPLFAQQVVPVGAKSLTISTDMIAIVVTIVIAFVTAGMTHLKMVWDIRSDLRHGLEELKTTRIDVDQIKGDVETIKLRDVQHEARISALERAK
jgi:hypothetical protein